MPGHICVEAAPVFAHADHLYLVYRRNGEEWTIRSGPANKKSLSAFGKENIVVLADYPLRGPNGVFDDRKLDDSPDARPDCDVMRARRGCLVLDLGDRDPDAVWATMVAAAKDIEASGIKYHPLKTNSNATIAYVLEAAGFPYKQNLPKPKGLPYFPGARDRHIGKIREAVALMHAGASLADVIDPLAVAPVREIASGPAQSI